MVAGLTLLTPWGVADSHGQLGVSVVRDVHLTAFSLWLGARSSTWPPRSQPVDDTPISTPS